MRVTRQTATELVIEDSCLWIAALLALVSLPLIYQGVSANKPGSYVVAAFFLLCALLCIRKSRFVFDAQQRVVRWETLVLFKTSPGRLPFDQIRAIRIETNTSERSTTYRLTLVTADKPVPLSSAYSSGQEKITRVQQTLATFLGLQTGGREPAEDVDASILELVCAGRKIDAIALLRRTRHLSLTDAKQMVDLIASSQTKP